MSPSHRRRIVLGLSLLLAGIAVSILGPVIAGLLLMPKYASDMARYMSDVYAVGSLMTSLIVGGLAVATLGFGLVIVEWARWFARPRITVGN